MHPRPGFLAQDPEVIAAEDGRNAPPGAATPVHDIRRAQDFYRALFQKLEDQAWNDAPRGPLAEHWQRVDGWKSTNYVVRLASVIDRFVPHIYPGLTPNFYRKLKSLLRPNDSFRYEETLVELEVGSSLSEIITPIELEPLVPLSQKLAPNPPKSPDYGLWLPESNVTVEVTVWHWETYAAWERMYDQIYTTLCKRLQLDGVRRQLRIELPINSPQEAISWLTNRRLCKEIRERDFGGRVFGADTGAPIVIRWSPVLHFDSGRDIAAVNATRVGPEVHWTEGVDNIGSVVAVSGSACITEDRAVVGLSSLRRAIDHKKAQRDPARAHFLAMGLNSPKATWDAFGPIIEGRIWPNPKYSWLSGILEYSPVRTTKEGSFLGYNPNPNAAVPAPDSMMRLMSGREQFHTMWRRPRRHEAEGH
ncbi:hypothetical protein [Mycobacterium sp. MMS18-G62]